MNSRAILLCLLLGAAFLLGGCQKPVLNGKEPAEHSVPDAALTEFSFSESNSYFKRVQSYEFRMEEGKANAFFFSFR